MYRLFRQSKHLSTSLISIPALSIPQPNTSFFTPKSSYTKKNAVNTQKPVRKIILLRTDCIFGQFCKLEFVKEIYNMKKVCLAVLPALTIVLELLPFGAVCIFATSPTERVKETFSYFSLTPFGYANFAPLITATLTVAIFLLSLFSLKKKGVLKALFVLSIITVVISLLPLMYGLNYYTLVGAFITVTLVIESILAKM